MYALTSMASGKERVEFIAAGWIGTIRGVKPAAAHRAGLYQPARFMQLKREVARQFRGRVLAASLGSPARGGICVTPSE